MSVVAPAVPAAPIVSTPILAGSSKSWWARPSVIWACALIPHAVAIGSVIKNIATGRIPGNLENFVGAASQMLHGGDIYAGKVGGYCYPPLIAFLYQPLAMLPPPVAAVASLCINAAISIFTLMLVARVLTRRITGKSDPLLVAQVALFAAVCTADKIKAEFNMLETNVFMLLAFTVAMRWVDKRPWLSGLALGFAFNIKYLPIVLVPYLLLRRRWGAVGWFAMFAAAWGLLPALSMGWQANLHAWSQASAGLLGLFGVHIDVVGGLAAPIKPITNRDSISVPSGIARMTGLDAHGALLAAGAIGMVFCIWAAAAYRRRRFPIIAWPGKSDQAASSFCGLLSVEWMGMLLLTLIFSPFTNARHLYMLLDVNIAAGALLLGTARRVPRAPLIIGAFVMFAGITLPPGGDTFRHAQRAWQSVSGPAWCMLAMYVAIIWTNLRWQRVARADAIASA